MDAGQPVGNRKENMGICACCEVEHRRLRRYQKVYGDESSEVMICSNCFTEALDLSKDILEHAGSIAFIISKGNKSYSFTTTDGRQVTVEIE